MDKIIIKEIELYISIGLTAEERLRPQKILLDVELGVPSWSPVGQEGDISKTVCYQSVCQCIENFIKIKPWILLEELLEDLQCLIFESYKKVNSVKILARKFVVDHTSWTGVEIERSRRA